MSLALDANLLIDAANIDSAHHQAARTALDAAADGDDLVYLFWPVALEFLRDSTHPRLFRNPLDLPSAFGAIEGLTRRPNVRTGVEGEHFAARLREVAVPAAAKGKLVHDAHIVALMREHGVNTIWTTDRDFMRFAGIRVVDPFA